TAHHAITSQLVYLLPRQPSAAPFPYTTLFRSRRRRVATTCRHRRRRRRRRSRLRPRRPRSRLRPRRRSSPPPRPRNNRPPPPRRSEEHTSELQSRFDLVCRLLLEKKNEIRRKS